MATVLQTDFAWPDVTLERDVIETAGHCLVTGPSTPLPSAGIEALVAQHQPQAIMTCWAEVSEHAISFARGLRIVQRIGVGLDNIAVQAATVRGAWVTNVPDYCVAEVSDHAMALLLAWARGITLFDCDVKAGRWNPASARLRRVADLTVGIVGLGRIGRATAEKLKGFGVRILAHDPHATNGGRAELVPLARLLAASDAVILHVPLTTSTHHLIGKTQLAQMKCGAFLINVSRGGLVDNDALLAALRLGTLSGAGLDVVEGEPEPPRELAELPQVIVTPHIAFSSEASLVELRRRATEEVVRVLAGMPPLYPCNQPNGLA